MEGGGVTGGGNVPGGCVGGTLVGGPGFTGSGIEGGTGAMFGPEERPVGGNPTLELFVIATGGTGKVFTVGETPVPVAVLVDDEVPPAAVETLK